MDWRLKLVALSPVTLSVEQDDDFSESLAAAESWKARDQARAWICGRVVQLAASMDKTSIRRFSLQLPDTPEDAVAEALLSNLERRIRDTVLDDLVAHFEDSIPEWERKIQVEIAGLDDPDTRWHARRYVGLDQPVSVDACRKAIRFIFSRSYWYLTEENDRTVLTPDWRFEQVRALRSTLDEQTRARSLVARCIEVLVDEHVREQRAGVEVAPMTRLRLKAEIERLFHEKGCWGLIELALPRDRSRHYLRCPEGLVESLQGLIMQQEQRLGVG
ncbi:MAG: hypothetical protein ACK4FB_00190 [Brevundimonas sp.]|uniref:hypothetical protein n=1 Tax=Brevundimonas sp. TaxID=1871086 RepID=UPI00391D21B4